MDNVQQAIENFRSLDFYVTHKSCVPPIGNADEIARLQREMLNTDDSKAKFFLEVMLEEQTKGIEEHVDGFQSFDSFEGLVWKSNWRPWISGTFTPKDGNYR